MPSLELLIAFLIATSIFAYMPGPSMLYTAAQTIARGKRAGWFATLGIHLGGYFHVIAAAFGLAFVFQAVPPLFLVLKFAGAAYLVWLGISMIGSNNGIQAKSEAIEQKSAKRAFWESVSVEVLNPKTAIFYLAFLPQFVDPLASFPIWTQLLILGTIVNFMFSSADVICVVLADKVAASLKGKRAANLWPQRIGGGILVALGAKLALDK